MSTTIKKEHIPFTQVANEVLYDPNLSFKAKGLYAYLYSKPDGWDFAATRIAKETKEAVKSIWSTLKELEEQGYLYRTRQKDGRMIYLLNSQMTKSQTPETGVGPNSRNGSQPKRLSAETGAVSNTDSNSNTDIKSNTDTSPRNNLQLQEQAFEEFWGQYPRKVGKAVAKKKWLKLNPSCELKKEILAALEKHKQQDQWVKDNGQFIPHASTWLNQERWEDVVECQQHAVLDFTKR